MQTEKEEGGRRFRRSREIKREGKKAHWRKRERENGEKKGR